MNDAPRPAAPVKTILLGTVLVAALGVFAWHAWVLRFVDPPPWPDEAMFADVAAHVARTGSLGTTMFRESVPATETHYFLYPPLYPLVVGGVFALFGPSLLAMRMTSVALAALGLLLIHGVARRAGLGRPAAFGAVSLMAADLVYMRAAHNGRMEMLALLALLAVVWLGLGAPAPSGLGRRGFAMGVAAALAFLCHPIGAVAAAVALVMLVSAAWADGSRARGVWEGLSALVLGGAVALLPWGIAILGDRPDFLHQFGVQFTRKVAETHSGGCLDMTAAQWPLPGRVTIAVMVSAGVGLGVAGWRRPSARGLLVVQLLLVAAVLSGCEQWYAVYLVPLTCLGLASLVTLLDAPGARGLPGLAGLILAVIWALSSAVGLVALAAGRGPADGETAYRAWCRQVEETVPPGSRVVLDLVPTPYFGLQGDRGLQVRLFRLAGFEMDPEREGRAMDQIDYVVLGRGRGSRALTDSVATRGVWVADVGEATRGRYFARIYRMRTGAEMASGR